MQQQPENIFNGVKVEYYYNKNQSEVIKLIGIRTTDYDKWYINLMVFLNKQFRFTTTIINKKKLFQIDTHANTIEKRSFESILFLAESQKRLDYIVVLLKGTGNSNKTKNPWKNFSLSSLFRKIMNIWPERHFSLFLNIHEKKTKKNTEKIVLKTNTKKEKYSKKKYLI